MALLECLLAVGMALSLASTGTAEDQEAVQQVTGPLPWEQSFRNTEDHDGNPIPQNPELLESSRHGIVEDTSQTAYTQMLSNKLTQMFSLLTLTSKKCTETSDCKQYAGTLCCWIPGDDHEKHCVREVSRRSPGIIDLLPVFSRKDMLAGARNQVSNIYMSSSRSLEVFVLPVGQGDCVAMYCPNRQHLVMFDCGSKKKQVAFNPDEVKATLLQRFKTVTIFISHGDEDHYKYLPLLFPLDIIDHVIIGGEPRDYHANRVYQHNNVRYTIQDWIEDVQSKGKLYGINYGESCIGNCNDKLDRVPYHNVVTNRRITLADMNICGSNDIKFDIIAANVGGNTNQKSIVLKVTAEGRSVLLTGDIEGTAAETVAETVPDQLKSDIYQISHHGACAHANECPWLEAIQPKEAFVSNPYIGSYGHPRCEAITNLLKYNTIGTSWLRTIPFTCNKANGRVYTPYTGEICHSIFSTCPAKNTICIVRFTIGKRPATLYNCYPPDWMASK